MRHLVAIGNSPLGSFAVRLLVCLKVLHLSGKRVAQSLGLVVALPDSVGTWPPIVPRASDPLSPVELDNCNR